MVQSKCGELTFEIVNPLPEVWHQAFYDVLQPSIVYEINLLCQWCSWACRLLNTLRPRQNGHHFPDDIFKCIFLNGNVWIPIEISLKLVPKGPINNIPALVQIMAWRRPGDKPLSEPTTVRLLTHICVTRPQWVKYSEVRQFVTFIYLVIGGSKMMNALSDAE